jgi:poly(beta-D-mannuronate) lyase
MSVRTHTPAPAVIRRALTLALAGTAALTGAALTTAPAHATVTTVSAEAAASAAVAPMFTRAAATRTVRVATVLELAKAAATAKPGDRILLADGTYTLNNPVALTASGSPLARVVIAAENIGKAIIKGKAGFDVKASHLVIEGFTFAHAAELSIPAAHHHIRLTRNTFQLASTVKNWVTVNSDDCEIDHNTFTTKKTVGVFLMIAGPGTRDMAKRTHVHHNYFKDHTYTGANGGETIRVGLSTRQHGIAKALIEHNLLDNPDGDPEAISVKSTGNTIRHNILRGGRGTITLRHGARNTVDGNILTGGTTGIRAFGDDHSITNNIVQDSTREQLVEIGSGDIRTDTTGTNTHEAADRVLVAFNTLVTAATNNAISVGSTKYKVAPDTITVANNILAGPHGTAIVKTGTRLTWTSNILTLASPAVPMATNRVTDPQLTKIDGIYRLTATSPAIGAATGTYNQITTDLDGQPRTPGTATIGADHYTTDTANRTITTTQSGPVSN